MKRTFLITFLLIASTITGYSQQAKSTAIANKAVVAKILKAFDEGDVNALDKLIAKDAVSHSEMPPEIKSTGVEAVKEMSRMHKAAFPDSKTTVHVMGIAGDTVLAYFTTTGTNSGPFMGMPATNKTISFEGVDIIRVKNGMAVEHWGVYDNLKMMQQLGMMPPPPPPSAPAPMRPGVAPSKKN
jgi:steroid delta-isomerase-like uncharacterized protein